MSDNCSWTKLELLNISLLGSVHTLKEATLSCYVLVVILTSLTTMGSYISYNLYERKSEQKNSNFAFLMKCLVS